MSSDDSMFRNLVEHAVDTIFRMTPACEILYVSPAVRRQLGYEPNGEIGRTRSRQRPGYPTLDA
jgi:PAS domain S-box-containing protein